MRCRTLTAEVNPDCPDKCSKYENTNLVYIKSTGDKNIIHYLWSSITCIPPTLLIVETELNSKLNISWDTLLNQVCDNPPKHIGNAIRLDGITNSIGFQFSRLFFFNDDKKKGSYDVSDKTLPLSWDHFVWQNSSQLSKDSVRFTFSNHEENSSSNFPNSSISFDIRIDGSDGRMDRLPHLAFTEKSVTLEVSVKDVKTEEWFKSFNQTDRPRLMSEVFVMTGGQTSNKVPDFESITSIDDEYTPGVFRRIVLDLKNGEKEAKNSFLSWKPIGYNSDERIIANTLDIVHQTVEVFNDTQLFGYNSRIFEAFFDLKNSTKLKFSLTFGASDDDTYYSDKRLNSFTFVVGVDSAPEEELSFLVKIIIAVGFGLPAIVMVVSALYLIVRKIRKRKFNELLLSRSQTLEE